MKPKISVIIPVYNVEEYIEECLNSVINQTLKDIEIIVINDGSTDGSDKIIDIISKNDNRIKVIKQENRGVSNARNKGIISSNGDYIVFIDPDDYIEKNMLEKLYMVAKNNDCEIVQCNYTIDNKGEYIDFYQNIITNKLLDEYEINEDIKKNLIEGSLSTYVWDKIFKKSFIEKYNLMFREDLNMFEDWYFIMDAVCRLNRFIFLPESLYYYRFVPNSLSKRYIENYEKIVMDLQLEKLKYMEYWNLNNETYKSKYAIRLYEDIIRLINYILNENYKLNKSVQLTKLKTIVTSKLVKTYTNKEYEKLYISNTNLNSLYLRPILYGIRKEKVKFIYFWIKIYKFYKFNWKGKMS